MKNSLKYFDESGNSKEKEFIWNIINYICNEYCLSIDPNLIDKKFENTYKKKIITMNSLEDAYMLPFDDQPLVKVDSSDINLILDDIGLFLKNELNIDYGKIDDYKVLNKIVGFLYQKLLSIVLKYKKDQLIDFLYIEFEKNLSSMLIRQSNYANDIACYPNRQTEINNNINDKEIKEIIKYKNNEKDYFEYILKSNNLTDFICISNKKDYKENENYLLLSNMFYSKNITYSYEEYKEHLKSTKEYAKNNKNYKVIENKFTTFKNITITICGNNYVIIHKNANPTIHFVIRHPKLVDALKNFNLLVKE